MTSSGGTERKFWHTLHVRYLSKEWIAEADMQIRGLQPLTSELVVRYEVLDGPDGDRTYHVVFGPDQMAVMQHHESPNLIFSLPWECAAAIAAGTVSAQRSFLDGTMSLAGDAALLIGHQETFNNVADLLSDLRDQTEYI